MKVRIAFRSDIVIEGKTMDEVRDKWLSMPLFSDEARQNSVNFLDIDAVEDANTYKDLSDEFGY